jgi:TfoX/Sxy family transcriptional regulator of competence genes
VAYDEDFADDIRPHVAAAAARHDLPVDERKMFGGIAFMVGGKMACGIANENLMLRLGVDGATAALTEEHVLPMDFTGRPMKGYVYVAPAGVAKSKQLKRWVDLAVDFAATLAAR